MQPPMARDDHMSTMSKTSGECTGCWDANRRAAACTISDSADRLGNPAAVADYCESASQIASSLDLDPFH